MHVSGLIGICQQVITLKLNRCNQEAIQQSKSTCSCSTDQIADDAPEADESGSLGRQDADRNSATQVRERHAISKFLASKMRQGVQ